MESKKLNTRWSVYEGLKLWFLALKWFKEWSFQMNIAASRHITTPQLCLQASETTVESNKIIKWGYEKC